MSAKMNANSMAVLPKKVVSKIERPFQPQKVTWTIDGADNAYNWQIIKDEAKLRMEFGEGDYASQLEFGFGEYKARFRSTQQNVNYLIEKTFHSLQANLVYSGTKSNKTFEIEVFGADQRLKDEQIIPKTVFHFAHPVVNIKQDFVLKSTQNFSTGVGNPALNSPQLCEYPAEMNISITVTPVQCTTYTIQSANHAGFPDSETASIARAFWDFYLNGEDNYSDIKFESSDGIFVNAHRFVLAARNKKFHDLIEKEVKLNGCNGVIKIADVKGSLLVIILHWMYTGKLARNIENILEELINVCIQYELKELLKLLDGQLIKICNVDNMLRLYQLAKQNGMEIGTKNIAEFIKQNIG